MRRLLLISALAATLIGCSSASQQTHQSFADLGLYQAHQEQSPQTHSKRRVSLERIIAAKKQTRHRKNAEIHIVLKMDASSFVRPDDKSNTAKTETPPSSLLDDESVMKKAKATIAAKMGDPNSVEFEGIERAARKNAIDKSIDSICGFVRDKNSGPKPFLYVVQKDEAYVGGYTIAISAYRNICSITTLPDR
ncbi:MAG TPA: hypothetical protein VGU64_21545 [Terriglobales bacterium]|nr:hypothetical protein [Terriglobales bacterium]